MVPLSSEPSSDLLLLLGVSLNNISSGALDILSLGGLVLLIGFQQLINIFLYHLRPLLPLFLFPCPLPISSLDMVVSLLEAHTGEIWGLPLSLPPFLLQRLVGSLLSWHIFG